MSALKPLKRLVTDWFLGGMLLAVALAWLFPDIGRHGGALHAESLINAGVFLVFFLHGINLSTEQIRKGLSNWRLHHGAGVHLRPVPAGLAGGGPVVRHAPAASADAGLLLPLRPALDHLLLGGADRQRGRQRTGGDPQRQPVEPAGGVPHALADQPGGRRQRRHRPGRDADRPEPAAAPAAGAGPGAAPAVGQVLRPLQALRRCSTSW